MNTFPETAPWLCSFETNSLTLHSRFLPLCHFLKDSIVFSTMTHPENGNMRMSMTALARVLYPYCALDLLSYSRCGFISSVHIKGTLLRSRNLLYRYCKANTRLCRPTQEAGYFCYRLVCSCSSSSIYLYKLTSFSHYKNIIIAVSFYKVTICQAQCLISEAFYNYNLHNHLCGMSYYPTFS